MLEIEEKYIK